jgi:hypothetical protein
VHWPQALVLHAHLLCVFGHIASCHDFSMPCAVHILGAIMPFKHTLSHTVLQCLLRW